MSSNSSSPLHLLCLLFVSFSAVSASLEDSLASSAKATLEAIGAQEAALQAITQHTLKLKEAMEAEVCKMHKTHAMLLFFRASIKGFQL